jgi:hypothetical protein
MINRRSNPLDYLVIGHITNDKTKSGYQIGGTAAYAAKTAQVLGCNPGILTSCAINTMDLSKIASIPVFSPNNSTTTIFENLLIDHQRKQIIHQWAGPITLDGLPADWYSPAIVHFGPVAREVDPEWVHQFPDSYKGFTPQGIMRSWDKDGMVYRTPMVPDGSVLKEFNAIIFSIEDIAEDEDIIDTYAHNSEVLAVTEGSKGVRIYWQGDMRYFSAPLVDEMDSTGAGDIFAAAFFIRHAQTKNPWEAARFAVQVAAISVTRTGLDSIPTVDEIKNLTLEIL